jgi:hypothetical protein
MISQVPSITPGQIMSLRFRFAITSINSHWQIHLATHWSLNLLAQVSIWILADDAATRSSNFANATHCGKFNPGRKTCK